jgi:hypothetical protein
VLGILVVAFLAYPVDWAVWRVRLAMGGGMGSVVVNHYTVAELKGGKEEWYVDGTSPVDCSVSLLPEAGAGACWWVRRHSEAVTRY